MANRLAYSIVLTLCLIRWSGSSAVPVSETTIEPIQHEKQEAPPLDKFETVNGTEANVDILSATAAETADEPPVATTTTKSQPSLAVVLNPLLSPAGTDATTSPAPVTTTLAEETAIGSVTDVPIPIPVALNATELDLENATESTTSALPLPWPPTPSSTGAITTTAEVTTTMRTTYPDAESSAESFDSGESSSSYSSVSKSASVDSWPTEPSFAQDKTLLPLSTTPLPIPPLWPWMLFILNGNATVANRRQRDLGTYLRLNLAARLDADYNDVAINRILLTPQAIVANISVEPSHLVYGGTGAAGLEALGQGNVTLLELSGHEFQVDRIIRFDDIVDQRGMMSSMEMSSMATTVGSEVTVYGAVGAVFLFLLVALLLGLSFSSPCKSGDNGKYLANSNFGYDRDQMDCNYSPDGFAEWGHSLSTMELMPTPPPVIYTEQLARDIEGDCVGLQQLLKKPSHFVSSSNSRSRSPLTTTTDSSSSSSTLAEFHQHRHQRYPDEPLYSHNNHSASRS